MFSALASLSVVLPAQFTCYQVLFFFFRIQSPPPQSPFLISIQSVLSSLFVILSTKFNPGPVQHSLLLVCNYMKRIFLGLCWQLSSAKPLPSRIQFLLALLKASVVIITFVLFSNGNCSPFFRPASHHNTGKTWKDDGMNSLEFKLLSRTKHPLYTNVTVDIGYVPPFS